MFFDDVVENRKTKVKEVEEKTEKIDLWKIIGSLNYSKDLEFTEEVEKVYSPYMINRILSMNQDLIHVINEMNLSYSLSKKQQFDFYTSIIRKKKRYTKYLKAEKDEVVNVIKFFLKCSNEKAREAISQLSNEQIENLKCRYKSEIINK